MGLPDDGLGTWSASRKWHWLESGSIMRLGIGLGGMLLTLGLFWAVEINRRGAADETLGVTLMLAGGLAIALTVIKAVSCRRRRKSP
jgi:hypothetical protein